MRILIVGSGGREHALAWVLNKSPQHPELFIAPGNAGTASLGRNVPVASGDVEGLLTLAKEQKIDLTVVGPEQPLVDGIVDRFEAEAMPIVGPTSAAARLEGSKAFAKDFMERYGIPTAAHRTFSRAEHEDALAYLDLTGAPVVVKASGLAAGKGAIVCETLEDARQAVDAILESGAFGQAGDHVVIEEYMEGEEASVFALTDGERYVLLAPAQDHKRAGEGDTGPNTGGMGAYAPAPVATDALVDEVSRTIIEPTLTGMRKEGAPYRGFLYVGLMIGPDGPRVVEYNCRLGDPEAQVILPLFEGDFVDLLRRQADHDLSGVTAGRSSGAAACVVLASGGYPGSYEKGKPISGLEDAGRHEGVVVFHAGTSQGANAEAQTSGGRVLGVTAVSEDLEQALRAVYRAVDVIDFKGRQFRRDIGQKGLARLEALRSG